MPTNCPEDDSGDTQVKVGYAPGAFDLFHIGHLALLRRARASCDRLIAGVATDDLVERMKGRRPVVPYADRLEIVRAIRHVDLAIADTSSDKTLAWHLVQFDLLFKGSDWIGTPRGDRLERQLAEVGAEVVYLAYTEGVSTTQLIEAVNGVDASSP